MAVPFAEIRRATVLAPLVAIPLVARLADGPPLALAWMPVLVRPLVVAIGFAAARPDASSPHACSGARA